MAIVVTYTNDVGFKAFDTGGSEQLVTVSGSIVATEGLSGSLTRLNDGSSYLVAGSNISISSASNGSVTIDGTATASNWEDTLAIGNIVSESSPTLDHPTILKFRDDFEIRRIDFGPVKESFFADKFNIVAFTRSQITSSIMTIQTAPGSTDPDWALFGNMQVSLTSVGGPFNTPSTLGDIGSRDFMVGDVDAADHGMTIFAGNTREASLSFGDINDFQGFALIYDHGTDVFRIGNTLGISSAGATCDSSDNWRFEGFVSASKGFSGSLTNLSDGSPYLLPGDRISIVSTSNGPITIGTTGLGGAAAWIESISIPNVIRTTSSVAIDTDGDFASAEGSDVYFFVSGTAGGRGTTGVSVFGGDVVSSGNLDLASANPVLTVGDSTGNATLRLSKTDIASAAALEFQSNGVNEFSIELSATEDLLIKDANDTTVVQFPTGGGRAVVLAGDLSLTSSSPTITVGEQLNGSTIVLNKGVGGTDTAIILYQSTGSAIWIEGADADESWKLKRHIDNVFQDDAIRVDNTTGDLTIANDINMASAAAFLLMGDGTGQPTLRLNKGDGSGAVMDWFNAGTLRWRFQHTSTEDFQFVRFDSSGNFLDNLLTFVATTGEFRVANDFSLTSSNPVLTIGDGGGNSTLRIDKTDIASTGSIQFQSNTSNEFSIELSATEDLLIKNAAEATVVQFPTGGGLAVAFAGAIGITGGVTSDADADADDLVLGTTSVANTGLTIKGTGVGSLNFGDAALNDVGRIIYTHSTNRLTFVTNNTSRVRISGATMTPNSDKGTDLGLAGASPLRWAHAFIGTPSYDVSTVHTSGALALGNTGIVHVNPSVDDVQLDLPASDNANIGKTWMVIVQGSANTVTVRRSGSDTINTTAADDTLIGFGMWFLTSLGNGDNSNHGPISIV